MILLIVFPGCIAARAASMTVTIPHPSETALLPAATQINWTNEGDDARFGLPPGSMVDRAALTRVDGESVCVQLALSADRLVPERRDFSAYTFELEARDGAGTIVSRTAPEVRAVGEWDTQVVSHIWTYGPFGAQRQPMLKPVGHGAADLCFANDGAVTGDTRALSLVTRGSTGVRRFTWELDPTAEYSERARAAGAEHVVRPEPPPQLEVAAIPQPQAPLQPQMPDDVEGLTALPYPTQQIPGGHPPDTIQIRALLDSSFGNLRRCLSQASEDHPDVVLGRDGSIVLEFTVGPGGVDNLRVVRNDFTAPFSDCVERHIRALPIPPDPMRWTALYRYGVVSRTERDPE